MTYITVPQLTPLEYRFLHPRATINKIKQEKYITVMKPKVFIALFIVNHMVKSIYHI